MEAVSGGSAAPSDDHVPVEASGEKDEILELEQPIEQSVSSLEPELKAENPSFAELTIDAQGKFRKNNSIFDKKLLRLFSVS